MIKLKRRDLLRCTGTTAFTALIARGAAKASQTGAGPIKKGRFKQSVARWPFAKIPLAEFFRGVAGMGLTAVDLLGEEEWPIARQHGLACSMGWVPKAVTISDGLNVKANHDRIVGALTDVIPKAAKAGVPNVIAFFGNRRGITDAEGAANCVIGLNRLRTVAEDHGVNVCLELLNSKVDHKDYQGDRTAFGVEIVRAINSPRIKLLYDIYHMQIMEGDVIRTIRDNYQWIGHYHTGGVPGRHELDNTQELNWATICRAIADTGFTGYTAHEFIPVREPLASLREAVALCDV